MWTQVADRKKMDKEWKIRREELAKELMND